MEKKGKIIIGVVIVILAIIVGGYLILSNMDVNLVTDSAQVTLPKDYDIDASNGIASKGDTEIMFAPFLANDNFQADFFKAIKANGKDAGYKNITNRTVNGYTVYEYAGQPDKLQNVSTDREYSADGSYSWTTYPPNLPFETVTSMKVDHFRMVTYEKDGKVNQLTIFTNNSDTSLYTQEMENIITSIKAVEK